MKKFDALSLSASPIMKYKIVAKVIVSTIVFEKYEETGKHKHKVAAKLPKTVKGTYLGHLR
jgi:hypothetical protein